MLSFSRYEDGARNAKSEARLALAPFQSDTIYARALSAGVQKRVTIPADAQYVVFASTGDFFALFGGSGVAAAVPGGDSDAAAELNPAVRRIPSGDTHVSLIASAATTVTLSFYGE